LVSHFKIQEFREFYFCIEHCFCFTPKTLKNLLDSIGLKGQVQSLQEYPITNHIKWAYRKTHSPVLSAREGTPDVALMEKVALDEWEKLWQDIDVLHKNYLKDKGFADRVLAIVGPKG
jgi:hypothetical protein